MEHDLLCPKYETEEPVYCEGCRCGLINLVRDNERYRNSRLLAIAVEEFGRENKPPWLGKDPSKSRFTVDEWLEDVWQAAIYGAAEVVRESGRRVKNEVVK